jgi:hypothetical protein
MHVPAKLVLHFVPVALFEQGAVLGNTVATGVLHRYPPTSADEHFALMQHSMLAPPGHILPLLIDVGQPDPGAVLPTLTHTPLYGELRQLVDRFLRAERTGGDNAASCNGRCSTKRVTSNSANLILC